MLCNVAHEADYPLSYRFDETDSVLVCDRVKIPWERVFLHNDAAMSRRIYIETPANCYQNHQSNVRFWSKMGLIAGVASRMALDELRPASGSRADATARLFETSWQPERELADLARAPKVTDRNPGGPQVAI